jgi:hypothetical protein
MYTTHRLLLIFRLGLLPLFDRLGFLLLYFRQVIIFVGFLLQRLLACGLSTGM